MDKKIILLIICTCLLLLLFFSACGRTKSNQPNTPSSNMNDNYNNSSNNNLNNNNQWDFNWLLNMNFNFNFNFNSNDWPADDAVVFDIWPVNLNDIKGIYGYGIHIQGHSEGVCKIYNIISPGVSKPVFAPVRGALYQVKRYSQNDYDCFIKVSENIEIRFQHINTIEASLLSQLDQISLNVWAKDDLSAKVNPGDVIGYFGMNTSCVDYYVFDYRHYNDLWFLSSGYGHHYARSATEFYQSPTKEVVIAALKQVLTPMFLEEKLVNEIDVERRGTIWGVWFNQDWNILGSTAESYPRTSVFFNRDVPDDRRKGVFFSDLSSIGYFHDNLSGGGIRGTLEVIDSNQMTFYPSADGSCPDVDLYTFNIIYEMLADDQLLIKITTEAVTTTEGGVVFDKDMQTFQN